MQLQGTFKVKVNKSFSKMQWVEFNPIVFNRGCYYYADRDRFKLDISSVSEPELGGSTIFLPGSSLSRDYVETHRYHNPWWDYAIQAYNILKYAMPTIIFIDWYTEEELSAEDFVSTCYSCGNNPVTVSTYTNGSDTLVQCSHCNYSFIECALCRNTYSSGYKNCPICCRERICAFCGEYKVSSKKYIENSTGCEYYLCEDCTSKDITTAAKLRYDFKTTFTYRRFLNESVVNAISSRKRVSKSSFKLSRDTENTPTQQQVQPPTTRYDSELGQQVRISSWDFRPFEMWDANPCAESPISSESCEQQAEVPTAFRSDWDELYQRTVDRYFEQFYPESVATGRSSGVLPD